MAQLEPKGAGAYRVLLAVLVQLLPALEADVSPRMLAERLRSTGGRAMSPRQLGTILASLGAAGVLEYVPGSSGAGSPRRSMCRLPLPDAEEDRASRALFVDNGDPARHRDHFDNEVLPALRSALAQLNSDLPAGADVHKVMISVVARTVSWYRLGEAFTVDQVAADWRRLSKPRAEAALHSLQEHGLTICRYATGAPTGRGPVAWVGLDPTCAVIEDVQTVRITDFFAGRRSNLRRNPVRPRQKSTATSEEMRSALFLRERSEPPQPPATDPPQPSGLGMGDLRSLVNRAIAQLAIEQLDASLREPGARPVRDREAVLRKRRSVLVLEHQAALATLARTEAITSATELLRAWRLRAEWSTKLESAAGYGRWLAASEDPPPRGMDLVDRMRSKFWGSNPGRTADPHRLARAQRLAATVACIEARGGPSPFAAAMLARLGVAVGVRA